MKVFTFCNTTWFLAAVFVLIAIVNFYFLKNNFDTVQLLPSIVDMGENLEGSIIEKTMRVRNSFGFDAKFDEVITGCGCLSIWDDSGSPIDPTNFVIPAKSDRTLVARLNLEGLSGGFDRSFVLRSKDTLVKPIVGRIKGRVKGRVEVSVKQVNLGEIPMEEQSFRFNLSGLTSGSFIKNVAAGTTCFPGFADALMNVSFRQASSTDFLIEGTLKPLVFGDFCKFLEVNFSDGLPPVRVKVFGTVRGAVILSPSSVYLPRMSAIGELFTTQISCRATFGKRMTLEPVSVPDGLKVEVRLAETANELLVDLDASASAQLSTEIILRFNCKIDERLSQIEIPLSINSK